MKYHRLDEYGRPTDRSLLQDGFEQEDPRCGPRMLLATLLLLPVGVALWAGLYSLLRLLF